MSILDWFSSKKEDAAGAAPAAAAQDGQDQKKMLAENTQALVGLEQLVQKINASNSEDGASAAGMEEYLQRLRQEGRGI